MFLFLQTEIHAYNLFVLHRWNCQKSFYCTRVSKQQNTSGMQTPPFQNKKQIWKSGLKSSLIDIYECLFWIHRYIFNWPKNYFSSFFNKNVWVPRALEKSAFI